MPSAANYSRESFIKLMLIGNSGAGKTGALTSLVEAGYKLRILDMDSGLDALMSHVHAADPKLLEKIEYVSYRNRMKMTARGSVVAGKADAYPNAMKALESWPDDESDPAEWGHDTIFVLDSLTAAGRAAYQWAVAMNPTTKDPRQWYKTAQDLLEDLVANLCGEEFRTHVIIISHINYQENEAGINKGFVSAVGSALGPKLPRYVNTLLMAEVKGSGKNMKRLIRTVPTSLIELKNPSPMKLEDEYDLPTGLAKVFEGLKP